MRFNLDDYETVESRIKRFYELYEDGRITTSWDNDFEAGTPRTWVMKASVYLTAGDQANALPKATGYAFEVDGTGGANNTSALENAETSAIGRALANMNLSGNKRASREEMQKVAKAQVDWMAEADKVMNVEQARDLYAKAKAAKAPAEVLDRLKDIGKALNSGSKDS
jgi:hypothetical protein